MVATHVEAVLVRVTVAFDTSLEVVAAWGCDGPVGSQVDCGGWSDSCIGRHIDWIGDGEGKSRR